MAGAGSGAPLRCEALLVSGRDAEAARLAEVLRPHGIGLRACSEQMEPLSLQPRPAAIVVDGSCPRTDVDLVIERIWSRSVLDDVPVLVWAGPDPRDASWSALILRGVRHCLPPGSPDSALIAAVESSCAESGKTAALRRSLAREGALRDRDVLTGLASRAAFEQVLAPGPGGRRAGDDHVGVLLIDVDLFKKINDEHGHMVGDLALAAVGRRLSALMRAGDLAARWAGDEFAALLPEADLPRAVAVAERLVRSVAGSPLAELPDGGQVWGSVSVGVAVGPASPELVDQADRAMFAAKRAGRGEVAMAAVPVAASATPRQRRGVGRRAEDRARA